MAGVERAIDADIPEFFLRQVSPSSLPGIELLQPV